jgi:hypothetical protein
VKNENRPVEWAALGKEEAINWEEDHFQDTASHPQAESPTCPFCGVPPSPTTSKTTKTGVGTTNGAPAGSVAVRHE